MKISFLRTLILSLTLLCPACLMGCAGLRPVLTGELAGNLVWSETVRLRGDVILTEQSRLTILPGTQVVFLPSGPQEDRLTEHPHFPGTELIVRGAIIAEGRADQPIVFRHESKTAAPGSWGGINLQGSPDARFRFCRFTQADSALHSQESRVRVTESVFEGNLVAIRFHSTEFLIENNLLRDNGTGIRFHFGAPVIRRNRLINNEKGFFFTSYPRNYHIEENEILASGRYNVVLGEEVYEDVAMPRNFWGTGDPEAIAGALFDGRREGYLGRVLFTPFLIQPIAEAGPSWNP